MNAKRLTSIAALAMSAMMLVGCGNASSSEKASMTRADAVAVLGKIAAATADKAFVAPTKGVITTKNTKVNVSGADSFISVVYTADVTNKSNVVTTTKDTEVYGFGNAASYSVFMKSGTTLSIYTDTTGTLKASVDKKITAYLANATYASSFAKYLNQFNDDGSAVTGSTTAKYDSSGKVTQAAATLTKQSYTSTADTNLIVDVTAHYSYDEQIVYKWNNNLCVAQKSNNNKTFAWGEAVTTNPTTTDAEAAANGDAIVALM